MRLPTLLQTLEESIAKWGFHNQGELIPSLIKQVSLISKDSLGSYKIPSHAEEQYKKAKQKPIIWTDVYRDPEHAYAITIFRLFKGSRMPLHDHPDISGINYLLCGNIEYKSYDIVDVLNVDKRQFIGIKYRETQLQENDAIITLPYKENIHEFIANENTSILQILTPDYDHKERRCSYWEVNNHLSDDVKRKCFVDFEKNQTLNLTDLSMDDIVGLNITHEPEDKLDVNVPFDGLF